MFSVHSGIFGDEDSRQAQEDPTPTTYHHYLFHCYLGGGGPQNSVDARKES
jgi:hypothetical protein